MSNKRSGSLENFRAVAPIREDGERFAVHNGCTNQFMNLKDQTKIIQKTIGVTADGIYGPATTQALLDWLKVAPPATVPEAGQLDERSEKNIATLLPEVRPLARQLVRDAAKAGIVVKVISGNRTYAEQDALYAKGRTIPGPKVTNAKGGFSNHNFGLAFDLGVFKGSTYLEDGPEYKALGLIGEKLGLAWGGRWTSFKDYPHFEYNPKGYTTAQLRERVSKNLPLV
jgi:peptidoglycan L-alanyl-D-glutamate endopeptidase CwlK